MLSLCDISYTRGTVTLFKNIVFSVTAGKWLHIRGKNGAGKTSLLRLIAGLNKPDAGDIYWHGRTIDDQRQTFNKQLLFLGHHLALKEDLSTYENLKLTAAINKQTLLDNAIICALKQWQLLGKEHLPVRCLSTGQKKRASLAQLSNTQSTLWLLDEPLTALDTQGRSCLYQIITQHLAKNGIVILTAHQSIDLPEGEVVSL